MPAHITLARDLAMPLDVATSKLALIGKSGSGKTTGLAVLCEELLDHQVPVAIIDPTGAHWGLRSSANGKRTGYPVVIFGGRHADVPLEPGSGRTIAEVLVSERIPAILDLSLLRKGQRIVWNADFFETLYDLNREPLHVAIDEAHTVAPQRPTPDSMRMLGAVEDMVLLGRIRGLGVSMATQRPALLNKNVLTQIDTLIALRTTGKQDIDAIDDWINAQADDPALGKQVKASLASQPNGRAWVWSPHFLGVFKQVQIRPRRTFDSSATPKVGQVRIEPAKWATIDLAALGEKVTAAVENAKDSDPKALRSRIAALAAEGKARETHVAYLAQQLADRDARIAELEAQPHTVEVPVAPEGLDEITSIAEELTQLLTEHADRLTGLVSRNSQVGAFFHAWQDQSARLAGAQAPADAQLARTQVGNHATGPTFDDRTRYAPPPLTTDNGRAAATRRRGQQAHAHVAEAFSTTDGEPEQIHLRAGARRMVESLGRMYPLRLTKSQWGMVSNMRHTSGTFSTYLGELRRAGFIEEGPSGFTITDNGFDYLGHRPAPMTAAELQAHYLTILRAGAARMLKAAINAYPDPLTRDELAEQADIAATSGTFSTYLGELRRNGLVEESREGVTATRLLMFGANA